MRESYQSRAKQFLPYASLRGFEEIVEKKRRIKEPRRELAEDAIEEFSRVLSSLVTGDAVRVTYYTGMEYEELSCKFLKIDTLSHELVLDSVKIPLSDIFSVDIE